MLRLKKKIKLTKEKYVQIGQIKYWAITLVHFKLIILFQKNLKKTKAILFLKQSVQKWELPKRL